MLLAGIIYVKPAIIPKCNKYICLKLLPKLMSFSKASLSALSKFFAYNTLREGWASCHILLSRAPLSSIAGILFELDRCKPCVFEND